MHAGTVGGVVRPITVVLHPPRTRGVTAQSRTAIPPVPSSIARHIAFEESEDIQPSIPNDLRASFDTGPGDEISEQQLQTRLRDLPKINVEPEVVAAPIPPNDDRNVDTSDPSWGGKVESARLLKQVIPVYPSLARTARVQGSVILEATIGKSGKVEDVAVIAGHPMLIAAAVEAVHQWRYEPAKLNETPTRSSVRVTVVFRLEFPR